MYDSASKKRSGSSCNTTPGSGCNHRATLSLVITSTACSISPTKPVIEVTMEYLHLSPGPQAVMEISDCGSRALCSFTHSLRWRRTFSIPDLDSGNQVFIPSYAEGIST